MNAEAIRKYATLMQELDLTGLEVNENGAAIRLERNMKGSVQETKTVKDEPAAEEDGEVITSPMVGVFYTSPEENAEERRHALPY